MKCEIIRDLLPLYIDGLTNSETNTAIGEHLGNCPACQRFYQEMTGELPDILPTVEINNTELLKREQRRRRIFKRITIGIIAILCLVFVSVLWIIHPSAVSYKDVILEYGRTDNVAYVRLILKDNTTLNFSGSTKSLMDSSGKEIGSRTQLNLIAKRNLPGDGTRSSWESNINGNNQVYELVFEFSDKIITIRDGELISEETP